MHNRQPYYYLRLPLGRPSQLAGHAHLTAANLCSLSLPVSPHLISSIARTLGSCPADPAPTFTLASPCTSRRRRPSPRPSPRRDPWRHHSLWPRAAVWCGLWWDCPGLWGGAVRGVGVEVLEPARRVGAAAAAAAAALCLLAGRSACHPLQLSDVTRWPGSDEIVIAVGAGSANTLYMTSQALLAMNNKVNAKFKRWCCGVLSSIVSPTLVKCSPHMHKGQPVTRTTKHRQGRSAAEVQRERCGLEDRPLGWATALHGKTQPSST